MPKVEHPYYPLREICRQYGAALVVVSKTRTIEAVKGIYDMGQRDFAENRVQELMQKVPAMPGDVRWHIIGHLQTNKVKEVIPLVTCIQSLDSEKLWHKIQEEASKANKVIQCLLQIRIAKEETKYGWDFGELEKALRNGLHHTFPNVVLGGVMGMATLTEDADQIRREMRQLKMHFDLIKRTYFNNSSDFNTISMGMSGDYKIALEEGSTMIRIGSLLFP